MRLHWLNWLVGLTVLAAFGWAGLSGWHYVDERPKFLPRGVRTAPGGYRSYHFWHSGWHGGK
jgi:hypothetical protein